MPQSEVQTNMGILDNVMPGARIFRMVVTRFTPDKSVPAPEICSDQR